MSVVRDRLGGGETGGEKASTSVEVCGETGSGEERPRETDMQTYIHTCVRACVRACVLAGGRSAGQVQAGEPRQKVIFKTY